MKFGIENLLQDEGTNITLVSSVTPIPGSGVENILGQNSLHSYAVDNGTVTLTIEISPGIVCDIISLFNARFGTSLQVKTYSSYPSTVIETKTFTSADEDGIDNPSYLFTLTDNTTAIVAIELIFTGASSYTSECGYIWAGKLNDLGCLEASQAFDESQDVTQLSRANTPDTNEEYNRQRWTVTTKADTAYTAVRSQIRELLTTGVGVPRPWVMDDLRLSRPEVFLGIPNSGSFGYSFIDTTTVYNAQLTFTVIEVF